MNESKLSKKRRFRAGGYSVLVTAVVLAIVIILNVLVGLIPTRFTKLDTTDNRLFSISEKTKKVLDNLDGQVTLYWIVRANKEDYSLSLLLDRYEGMSGNIKVVKKDPDLYPTFIAKYTENAADNSVIVEYGDRSKFVDNADIYVYDYANYAMTGDYDVTFAGEVTITSAISFVTSDDLPAIGILNGHGETALPDTFRSALEKENFILQDLSLLTSDIPEEMDGILIHTPRTDISTDELEKLRAFTNRGGSIFLLTDPPEDAPLANLSALMADYALLAEPGIVVESDRSRYYAGKQPYYLLPALASHAITDPLIENGYNVLLPIAQGLLLDNTALPTNADAYALLITSDTAFSKVDGWNMRVYEKEEGDIDGPFALAAAVEDRRSTGITRTVWVSSATLLDEDTNAYASGGNQDFFLNAMNWLCGQDESSMAIHSKSLSFRKLTISDSLVTLLTTIVVAVVPLVYLAAGLAIWIRRKRR